MRPFTAFTASVAGVIIIAALGLTGCSSATTTPTPLRLAAPTLIDCGDEPSERSRESVMVVNRTSAIVRVWTRGIDCYDWGGTSNPSRLDGIELSPGVSSANETFVVREIPQANNQIRPWDMGIYYWDGSQWLSTRVEPRPTFGAAKETCNRSRVSRPALGSPYALARTTENVVSMPPSRTWTPPTPGAGLSSRRTAPWPTIRLGWSSPTGDSGAASRWASRMTAGATRRVANDTRTIARFPGGGTETRRTPERMTANGCRVRSLPVPRESRGRERQGRERT